MSRSRIKKNRRDVRRRTFGKDQATKSIQEDALVHGAEEGRDKLRKATGSRK